jgi:hypothetical protein
MDDYMRLEGRFAGRRFEGKEVMRELRRGDPVGEALARRAALKLALAGNLTGFEEVCVFEKQNTISLEWYNFFLTKMLKGDAYSANVRMGVFSGNVVPANTLVADPGSGSYFRTALTEFTNYTVDGGNATNRSTTTFATASSQSITNSAVPSRFTFGGNGTLYGGFVVHGATAKDGSNDAAYPTACYIAGGQFSPAQAVAAASIIDLVYTMNKAA